MGYTHYRRVPSAEPLKQAWPQLLTETHLIINSSGIELCLSELTPKEPPLLNERSIEFNGWAEAHEPFNFRPEATIFACCKTARKEYDLVVTAILLRAFQVVGKAIDVSSDGDWDGDWVPARDLVEELWPGRKVECPWAERDDEERGEE